MKVLIPNIGIVRTSSKQWVLQLSRKLHNSRERYFTSPKDLANWLQTHAKEDVPLPQTCIEFSTLAQQIENRLKPQVAPSSTLHFGQGRFEAIPGLGDWVLRNPKRDVPRQPGSDIVAFPGSIRHALEIAALKVWGQQDRVIEYQTLNEDLLKTARKLWADASLVESTDSDPIAVVPNAA
jgi:hypothetical protein